jgi:peptidoglycan-associated lipoprotein
VGILVSEFFPRRADIEYSDIEANMNQSLKCIGTAFILTLALTGCHHAVTTAKTPQAPPPQPAATEAAPVVKPAAPTVNPVVAKKPELTDEQLFAQNVKDIFFSYDNADVRTDEQQNVSGDAAFLASHPALKVTIEGHCDERGSDEYNLSLGESRADKIKNALVREGISADRSKVRSLGKEQPLCSSAENDACWQQNRRAHFVLQPRQQAKN